ncbi:MAG: carbohydrate-binding domain-containing protein [Clostridiales bacterium]|jgi:hypothetical protein|nr:carbohydrate-binding domain-containing protein [Clostridiales bacterium]
MKTKKLSKKQTIFKALSSVAATAVALTALPGCTALAKDVNIVIDGEELNLDVAPQIIDGRVMVPIRGVLENLGALVKWDDETQTVSARKSSKTVSLEIGSNDVTLDKGETNDDGSAKTETIQTDVAAQLVSDRTLVPLRVISEAMGYSVDWNDETYTASISTDNDEDESWNDNKVSVDMSTLSVSGDGASVSDNTLTISKGGVYTLSGKNSDAGIVISTDDKVKLKLNGVNITSSGAPVIYVENADKLYIDTEDGTDNSLVSNAADTAAIRSKDNLKIKGGGTLNITSADNGIKCSDNLKIEGGKINIDAKADGINVNDTFEMTDGNLKITAVGDGIDSSSIANISGGTIDITTNGTPTETLQTEQRSDEQNRPKTPFGESSSVEFETSSKGIKADWMIKLSGGKINVNSADHAIHCTSDIETDGANLTLASQYKKGISAHGRITIDGTDTSIDVTKSTEGIEGKTKLTINNGNIKINSTDDGLNAGTSTEMQPPQGGFGGERGQKDRRQPQDGQQPPQDEQQPPQDGQQPPQDGQQPPQDGQQPPQDGQQLPQDGQQPPQDGFSGQNNKDVVIINGGNIEVTGRDDAIDVNGNLVINGGTIKLANPAGTVTGPFAALDADGNITIADGATLIAAVSGAKANSLGITQNSIIGYAESELAAGTTVSLKDDNGDTIIIYAPQEKFSAVYITSPSIEIGKNYTLEIGDTRYDITADGQISTVGTPTNNNGNFGGKGFGGGFGGRGQRKTDAIGSQTTDNSNNSNSPNSAESR